jgi:hypothetical protein
MKIRQKLFNWILQRDAIRFLISFMLRLINYRNKEDLIKYLSSADNKKIISFNCRESYEFEHVKEIFLFVQGHPHYFPFPISTRKKDPFTRELFRYFYQNYNLIYNKNFFPYFWLPLIKSEVIIETAITTYADISQSKYKILYAHGLSSLGFSKNHDDIRYVSKYDYIFVTGPLQKKSLLLAQKRYGGHLPELVEIGFLRGDRLIRNKSKFDKKGYLKNLGLENKFTVLYAPTWGYFSSTKEWIDSISDICEQLDTNLLIRLHPLMFREKSHWATGGIDWKDKLVSLDQKYKNIRIVSDDNVDENLLCADAMITDASSLGIEFMILEKPVIFLPCPEYFQLFGREKPIAWVREGREIFTHTDLRITLINLKESIFSPSILVTDVLYNPGKSLHKISQFLDDLLISKGDTGID